MAKKTVTAPSAELPPAELVSWATMGAARGWFTTPVCPVPETKDWAEAPVTSATIRMGLMPPVYRRPSSRERHADRDPPNCT